MDDPAHAIILIGPSMCGKTVCSRSLLKNDRKCSPYKFIPDEPCGNARGGYTEQGDLVHIYMYQVVDAALNGTHVGCTRTYMLFGAEKSEDLEQIAQRDPEALIIGVPHQPTEALLSQKFEEALGHTGKNIKGDA